MKAAAVASIRRSSSGLNPGLDAAFFASGAARRMGARVPRAPAAGARARKGWRETRMRLFERCIGRMGGGGGAGGEGKGGRPKSEGRGAKLFLGGGFGRGGRRLPFLGLGNRLRRDAIR